MQVSTRFASLAGGACCCNCRLPGLALCDRCARGAIAAPSQPPPEGVDRIQARWAYEGAPRRLVLDLKLRGARSAAIPLGRGLADLVHRTGCRSPVLTWVPGRPDDERVRGFDHARLIAGEVAAALGLPLVPLLGRRTSTADQAGLSRAERSLNLKGAFTSVPISGWVGLVDDVVTSGATARACSDALKEAGCEGIEVLTACRA